MNIIGEGGLIMQDLSNDIVVLNPDYHFKNDYDRIIMYSRQRVQKYSSSDWMSFIHPVQAMILNCFSTIKEIGVHYSELSERFNLPYVKIKEMIEPYIENPNPVYTIWKGQKVAFPKNVLVRLKNVSGEYNCEHKEIPKIESDIINLVPDRSHKGPQYILFMLTNKCVTNCKYCYADRKTRYTPLPTDKILSIIDEAKAIDVAYVDIIGGEVFCRKDWNIILKKLVDMEMTPNYISTKMPLSEDMIKVLYETGYDNVVQISLDSMDDDVLSKTIGSRYGYVSKMKECIRNLEKYGFKIQIDTILTKYNSNEKSLIELFDFIKTIGSLVYWEIRVPEVSIYTPVGFHEIKAERKDLEKVCSYINNVLLNKAEIKIIYNDKAMTEEYRNSKPTDEGMKERCGILKNRIFVLPDGKVGVCEQLYWHPQFIIGDLNKQSLCEVWKSKKAIALFNLTKDMFKDSPCFDCKALEICNKKHYKCFVKVIKAYGKDKWNYPDPHCVNAPKFMSDLTY